MIYQHKIAMAVFAIVIALSSSCLSDAFSPTQHISQSRIVHQVHQSSSKRTSIRVSAAPPSAWWALGHVMGGTSGAAVVMPATKPGSWYRRIDLPSWTPPDRIFAPVWTTLYTAMGVAASRVYKTAGASSPPMILWDCHYLLNLVWAPVFFGMKKLRLGMAINYLLLSSLAAVITMFYQVDKVSGLLLLPYLAWTIFATFLNGEICKRNPTDKDGFNNAVFQSKLCKLQEDAAAYADS